MGMTSTQHKGACGRRSWAAALVAVPVVIWLGLALWFQLPQGRVVAVALPVVGLAVVWWAGGKSGRASWTALAMMILAIALWWSMIQPRQDRAWAAPVAHGVEGRREGQEVTLTHVRDFRWRTRDEAVERWITTTVDLDQLVSVDFVRTVWASPHIAHTMISYGFADGQYLAFSAEIRREDHEAFSELGGFFKQFELVLIGATEQDIIRLRTHARGEDVSLYRLNLTAEQAQALFMSYVDLGNDLAKQPRFYQTVVSNCTTMIWKLARQVKPGLPMDWRVLLSGHSQDYLYDIGAISNDRPLADIKAEAPVTARAQALPDGADYSVGIRAGMAL
jgi:hypothetical protein